VKISKVPGTIFLAATVALLFGGADWTRFRGPDASGASEETGLPATWSAEENVVWKTALPGAGASSPITVGDKIFLTCYDGYGLDADNPGDQENLQLNVVALDRATGEIAWSAGVKPRLPQTEYRGFIALHGYASSTPVSDGAAVYAFFGSSGVAAFGVDGKPLWRADVGTEIHGWGSAASPILFGDLVIVNASVESKSIVALDKTSGKEVWRTEGIEDSWSTPLVVELPSGPELVVSMKNKVLGLDPASGRQLWECAGVQDYICPSVIAHDGIVYITAGRKPQTLAVRAGGRGDVTAARILWEVKTTPKVATPVCFNGHLYWLDQSGVATCLNAANGEEVYKERLEIEGQRDKVYASMTCADGKLYAVTRQGGTVVLAAKPEFEEIARNDLGDSSVFNGTPVPDGGRLLLRSDRFLYCIGK
jgi:hypothetical protein